MIETAVVDLDDTLVATAAAYRRALSVLSRHGVDPGAFVAAHQRWWALYEQGRCTMRELYEGRMLDCGLTGDDAVKATDRFIEASTAPRLRPGARRLLLGLRDLRIRTVILTNGGSVSQRRKVERLGLDRLVDAIAVSEEVGHAKPSPAAFAAALRTVGGRPAGAAMVGDDLESDVRAALTAGYARAVWVSAVRARLSDERIVRVGRLDRVLPALGLTPAD